MANFCGRCGTRVRPTLRFCEQCGHRLSGADAPKPAEIPKTRLAMQKTDLHAAPRAHPSAPASSGPVIQLNFADDAAPPALPTRSRWPWIVFTLLLLAAGGAVASWFVLPVHSRGLAARFGVPTYVGQAEVSPGPGVDVDGFRVTLASLPSTPGPALSLATPVFEITPPSGAEAPCEVSLPLLDPDDRRGVIVGHYHDGAWEELPTEVVDGRAIAVTTSFSRFAGWHPGSDTPASINRATMSIPPPRLLYGEVLPDALALHFDLRGQQFAHDEPWGHYAVVQRLRVEVNRPVEDRPQPGRNGWAAYEIVGGTLEWAPGQGVGVLPVPFEALSRRYDNVSPVSSRRWDVRVTPVFASGETGATSEAVSVYPDVLRALAHLNRDLPLSPAQRAIFDRRVAEHPLRVVYGGYALVNDAYNASQAWSSERAWGRLFGGVAGPHFAVSTSATYGNVVTHEWGHYAAHMILGDTYQAASPTGAHNGWVQSSRQLAFSEDLATWMGQWASGRGVPWAAGAMFGRSRDMSRHPEGEGSLWPSNRNQDAPAVEIVPATVMSRMTHETGFPYMFDHVAAGRPTELLQLVERVSAERPDMVQRICMDEGVSWVVRGQVNHVFAPGEQPVPVEGAEVHVRSMSGQELRPPEEDAEGLQTTTDAMGWFQLRVPPGQVEIVAEKSGLSQREPMHFEMNSSVPTNPHAIELLPRAILMEERLSLLIEAPVAGAVVTERILLVSGEVTTREGEAVDTVTLHTENSEVQAPVTGTRFEGRVTLSPGANVITATARAGEAEASATVTVEAQIDASVLMCELTWNRNGTDIDLWVTDPENVRTGFRNRTPREGGRLLDVDNTQGFGPETYTMRNELPGVYRVRVNYYRGEGPVAVRVRCCVWEATPEQRCTVASGTVSDADGDGQTPAGNYRFDVEVPRR